MNAPTRIIFKNAQLILPDRIAANTDVLVENGRIADISRTDESSWQAREFVDLEGNYLSPGFIDIHIHGAMGHDTMDASERALEAICNYHAAGGTTSLLATTTTAAPENISHALDVVEAAMAKEFRHGAHILGAHVEGPFISSEKPGAQTLRYIHTPSHAETAPFLSRGGVIKRMTLAPELPGALELIDALVERHIRPTGGHSDARDDEARAAFEHGMRQVTHTFNCMSSSQRRGMFRVAGLLEYALSEPGILCELIADNRHVSPTLMKMLYRSKGPDGICLVTDATAGAGLAEGRKFKLAEVDCIVRDEAGVTADGTALAGSTANMIRLVRNMVNLVGVPLHEAIRMATLNPAKAIGIETKKGTLIKDADADFVVLSKDLEVTQTYIGARCVYSR